MPSLTGSGVLTAKYVFDRTGRLLEDWHAIAGDAPERLRYQVFRSHYEPKGLNYEIDTFEIDPALEEKPIDLHRHLVKFDSRDRCIEESDIDGHGEANGKNTYTYGSHNNLIRAIDYNFRRLHFLHRSSHLPSRSPTALRGGKSRTVARG